MKEQSPKTGNRGCDGSDTSGLHLLCKGSPGTSIRLYALTSSLQEGWRGPLPLTLFHNIQGSLLRKLTTKSAMKLLCVWQRNPGAKIKCELNLWKHKPNYSTSQFPLASFSLMNLTKTWAGLSLASTFWYLKSSLFLREFPRLAPRHWWAPWEVEQAEQTQLLDGQKQCGRDTGQSIETQPLYPGGCRANLEDHRQGRGQAADTRGCAGRKDPWRRVNPAFLHTLGQAHHHQDTQQVPAVGWGQLLLSLWGWGHVPCSSHLQRKPFWRPSLAFGWVLNQCQCHRNKPHSAIDFYGQICLAMAQTCPLSGLFVGKQKPCWPGSHRKCLIQCKTSCRTRPVCFTITTSHLFQKTHLLWDLLSGVCKKI